MSARKPTAELPTQAFSTTHEWSQWLAEHHAASRGMWLKLAKKESGVQSITYEEALSGALCWGWIDGQKRSFDERHWLQKFTPRGAKSLWSKANRDRAVALIASGQMRPPGLEEVERAKQDGRWDAAYDGQRVATVPEDLAAALAANPRAAAFFATIESHNRYAILFRLHSAKKPETRAKRLAQFVKLLEEHKTLHPSRRPG